MGIALSRSVKLLKAATSVPYKKIQAESREQWFEGLLQCQKLVLLAALKPVARKILKGFYRQGKVMIEVAMDRSMINDTLNLLHLIVCLGGRVLPLG